MPSIHPDAITGRCGHCGKEIEGFKPCVVVVTNGGICDSRHQILLHKPCVIPFANRILRKFRDVS